MAVRFFIRFIVSVFIICSFAQFHSDNEVGLGPLVAGLSLGSPALMHFRLHPKFDPERTKKGILLSVVLRHVRLFPLNFVVIRTDNNL